MSTTGHWQSPTWTQADWREAGCAPVYPRDLKVGQAYLRVRGSVVIVAEKPRMIHEQTRDVVALWEVKGLNEDGSVSTFYINGDTPLFCLPTEEPCDGPRS